jgi:hypothetical protein
LKHFDYCGLEAKISGFEMDHKEGKKIFCCEGCKAIYKLFGAMLDVKNKKLDSIVAPNCHL